MEIYNQDKTTLLKDPDLEKGYLKSDQIIIKHPEQQAIPEQSHYITTKTYPNGGQDVKKIIDIPARKYQPARDEITDILVYIPYTEKDLLQQEQNKLREWRQAYFKIIDRAVWYDTLTSEQKEEVKRFRQELLDITITMIKPTPPTFMPTPSEFN